MRDRGVEKHDRVAEMREIARNVVARAKSAGAHQVEAIALEGDEFDCRVRLGEIEQLVEAGSSAVGVRVIVQGRAGSAYTSDLSSAGLEQMIGSALQLAAISTPDDQALLPDADAFGSVDGDLQLFDPNMETYPAPDRIELARRAERAAMAADPRVSNSEGGSFGSGTGIRAFANSAGFDGAYRTSSCSLMAIPVVQEDGRLQRDSWFHSARFLDQLESPEWIGKRAADRVLRRLGARKVATQNVPIVFEPRAARSLLGHIFSAVNGEAVYRRSSFLTGKLGEMVASPLLTVIDDGTLPGRIGSRPFDGEGLSTRRTVVIENGVLQSYLLNTYAARKLNLRSTGNAARGATGAASVGHGNLFIQEGGTSLEEMVGNVKTGLFVTELLGSGVNIVNGDYSRGAAGLWIENGELAYPVHEITVSGNLARMLQSIEAVGSELEIRGSMAAPALRIGEMTVSGH